MKKFIIAIVSFSPLTAFAQQYTGIPVTNATSFAAKLTSLFNTAINVLIALAVLWIIVSVVVWLVDTGEGKSKWRNNALWGIVGLAVILSIWGLVHLLTGTANFGNNGIQPGDVPQVPVIVPTPNQ